MSKGEHLLVYIIEFVLGLFVMNFLLMVSPLMSVIFFVVYINIIRANHRKAYGRDNPDSREPRRNYRENSRIQRGLNEYDPYSEEEKQKRKNNYHDD